MAKADYKDIEKIVAEVLKSIGQKETKEYTSTNNESLDLDPQKDFPLAEKHPGLVKTPTGIGFKEITLEKVVKGEIKADDLRISPETLKMQAQIAEKMNRVQLAQNFRRAAELTKIGDEKILSIYNALRPNRSSKQELLDIAEEIESKYGAKINAAFIREAADVYERRNLLA
jgi:propanediol dehydratase small subunit